MGLHTIAWARLALKQQVEIFGGAQVSLDSLWRAVGSPAGHNPEAWSALAAPFLQGLAVYLAKLEGDSSPPAARLVWIWEEESKDPWLTGDHMSDEFIAWAYATYLDAHLPRPAGKPASSLASS
jgi:hypothetical protein